MPPREPRLRDQDGAEIDMISEAFRAIWRIAIAIGSTLCARARSGRMSNPEPQR